MWVLFSDLSFPFSFFPDHLLFVLFILQWKPFLDGIRLPLISSKLRPCLDEAWPVILQALALDAVPLNPDSNKVSNTTVENASGDTLISGYSMVGLDLKEFHFMWGFALLVLFQGVRPCFGKNVIQLASGKAKFGGDAPVEEKDLLGLKLYEIVLPVFQFLATERFFSAGFLTLDICRELLQVVTNFLFSFDTFPKVS